MGTINCVCGEIFSDGEIPCPHEFHLLPNTKEEELTEKIVIAVQKGEDIDVRVGYLIMTSAVTTYQCPHCHRLIVFWNGLGKPAQSYKSEDLEELKRSRVPPKSS